MAREFIHQDDALASVHPANPDHARALLEGAPVPNKQLSEVVMGPGAFGSPDPATLAHTLLTSGDEMMVADGAPELTTAEDDESGSSGELTGDSTAKQFKEAVENAQNKDELRHVESIHDSRDEPFATVDQAIEKRHAQLDEEEKANNA